MKKNWTLIFKDIKKLTYISKLRSFQYRLLRRAITTNIQLKHWSIKDSDLCSNCGLYREDGMSFVL